MKELISMKDVEHIRYLTEHYMHLLEVKERMAIYHALSIFRFEVAKSDQNMLIPILRQTGWLDANQTLLDIKKEGREKFEWRIANKIIAENKDDIFFNYCMECGKLARTSAARQCHHCGYSWHKLRVARFEINSAFNVREKGCFLIGNLTEGEIQSGLTIDLVRSGFGKRPIIKSIELVLKKENDIPREEVALLVDKLSERDMNRLNNKVKTQVDIFSLND